MDPKFGATVNMYKECLLLHTNISSIHIKSRHTTEQCWKDNQWPYKNYTAPTATNIGQYFTYKNT